MKKSAKVTLTVVAAAALASCGRSPQDPCDSAYYDDLTCQEAIRSGGYYWNGTWMPMAYSHPYPYYYDRHRSYVGGGGRVFSAPSGSYARPSSSSHSGVTRGGFGSHGAAHSSGS